MKNLPQLRQWWVEQKLKAIEWCATTEVRVAAWPAKLKLDQNNPPKILVDNSVIRSGVTHTNAWISTGTKFWGGKIPFDSGYRARVVRTYPKHSAWICEEEAPFFAPLAHLGKIKRVAYLRSHDLEVERLRQSPGKYVGNLYGLSIWNRTRFESVDLVPRNYSRIWSPDSWSKNQQIDDLKDLNDVDFTKLTSAMGNHHRLDCLHLWTAHRTNCLAFLTVDKKFIRHFENNNRNGKLDWLVAKPMLPSHLSKLWGVRPVPIAHLSPIEASFPYVM